MRTSSRARFPPHTTTTTTTLHASASVRLWAIVDVMRTTQRSCAATVSTFQ